MTTNAIAPLVEYIEDGATLTHPIPFKFLANGDLIVSRIAAGHETILAYGVDYSAIGAGTDVGGTVTKVSAGIAGTVFRIKRATARSQLTDYAANDTFPADSHEAALDRQSLVNEEQDVEAADVKARSVLVPPGETGSVIAAAALRTGGGKILAPNPTTGAIEVQAIDAAFRGATGPANNSYASVGTFEVGARSTDLSAIGADVAPGTFTYEAGDFTGYFAQDPARHDFRLAVDRTEDQGAYVRAVNRDEYHYMTGIEYLGTFRANLCSGASGVNILFTTDSTGGSTGGTAGVDYPDLLAREAMDHGAAFVRIVAGVHPGTTSRGWIQDGLLVADLALVGGTPQLVIVDYTTNDPDSAIDHLTADQSLAFLQQGIDLIRLSFTTAQTAILVLGNNASFGRGRTAVYWDEHNRKLRRFLRMNKCAYFDVYNFARDAKGGSAWKSFDDLSATLGEAGAAAHFTDSMKGAVMHELARFLFGGLGAQKTNRFWTRSPSQHELLAGELPADFATAKIKTGAVVDRALAASGFIGDGMVMTILPTVPGAQIALQFHACNAGIFARFGGVAWLPWFQIDRLAGSKAFDWPDLATATQQSTTVVVTGAAPGDLVEGVSMSVALGGTRLWGEVTAADTVTVYQRNDTGGNVNVANGTLRVRVMKA